MSIPYFLEGEKCVSEFLLNERGHLEMVLGKRWVKVWTMGEMTRIIMRYPYMLYSLRKPFSEVFSGS